MKNSIELSNREYLRPFLLTKQFEENCRYDAVLLGQFQNFFFFFTDNTDYLSVWKVTESIRKNNTSFVCNLYNDAKKLKDPLQQIHLHS